MRDMVDLFSGLGGASEAMVQSPNWQVLRIENNPLLSNVPHTSITCVKKLSNFVQKGWYAGKKIDLIWASPPCREFSNGFSSPKSIWAREFGIESYKPNMSLLEAAIKIIKITEPKYWVIENVVGSIKYFEPLLGPPRQIIGPYVLWGNFPLIDVRPGQLENKKDKDVHSKNPLHSNYKAKVDFVISEGLMNAIDNQTTLFSFNTKVL